MASPALIERFLPLGRPNDDMVAKSKSEIVGGISLKT